MKKLINVIRELFGCKTYNTRADLAIIIKNPKIHGRLLNKSKFKIKFDKPLFKNGDIINFDKYREPCIKVISNPKVNWCGGVTYELMIDNILVPYVDAMYFRRGTRFFVMK